MAKLIAAFMLLFFSFSLLSFIYDGGTSGMATTSLTASLTSAGTTATVKTTEGFPVAGVVRIEDEDIQYNAKTDTTLTNLTRGVNGTDANSHVFGKAVYTLATGVINDAEGYSLIETGASPGNLNLITFPKYFITKVVPGITTWDYSFLRANELGEYIRYLGYCISSGFLFVICYAVLAALGGVLNGIFNR